MGSKATTAVLDAVEDLLAHPVAPSKLAQTTATVAHGHPPVTMAAAVVEEAAAAADLLPLAQRFPGVVARVRGVLRAEGLAARLLPTRSRTRALYRFAARTLGGRRIAALGEVELAALRAQLRRELVLGSPDLTRVVRRARARAKSMTGAAGTDVRSTAVDLPEGVWVFVHTTSPEPVVLVEAFAPRGTRVPMTAPAFPGTATPRWLPEGVTKPVPVRPPLPAPVATRAESEAAAAGAQLLDQAPDALVDQMLRAERHRLGQAWVPLTARAVEWFGDVPRRFRRTLGTGIERVRFERPAAPSGYDLKVVLDGYTAPTTGRFPDVDALPLPDDAFGPGSGMQRLHAWGNILGDSTPAGMGYGTRELNQKMLRTIESFLKAGDRGRVRLTVTAYLQHRPTLAGVQPFLRTVRYQWLDKGVARAFEVGVDEAGAVFARAVVP